MFFVCHGFKRDGGKTKKADVLRQLDIPWLHHPIDGALDLSFAELGQLWRGFDRDLRQGKLKHLEYNSANRTLSWHKPKTNNEEALQTAFTPSFRLATSPTSSGL